VRCYGVLVTLQKRKGAVNDVAGRKMCYVMREGGGDEKENPRLFRKNRKSRGGYAAESTVGNKNWSGRGRGERGARKTKN